MIVLDDLGHILDLGHGIDLGNDQVVFHVVTIHFPEPLEIGINDSGKWLIVDYIMKRMNFRCLLLFFLGSFDAVITAHGVRLRIIDNPINESCRLVEWDLVFELLRKLCRLFFQLSLLLPFQPSKVFLGFRERSMHLFYLMP